MSLGKKVRLNRLFSNPSGNLFSVAIDHFTTYNMGLPAGLRDMRRTLAAIIAGKPDAVTMHKGIALTCWEPYAGKFPFIMQSSGVRPDDTAHEQLATVEDAVRVGADAYAVVAFVHGPTEAYYLRTVAECVREGERLGMPIICHVYPRDKDLKIIFHPEEIAWAVHCLTEVGVDIVKVPYCGDPVAHAQIVANCPQPVVAAGGPKTDTMQAALQLLADAVGCGVRGGTIGRNVWGNPDTITGAVRAYRAVIHEGVAPAEAVKLVTA